MRRAVVPVVLAALAAGAGCTGAEEVRADDFRAQATRLCAQAEAASGDAATAQARLRRVLDLVPPPELAAQLEELRDIAGIVDRVGRNAARGNVSPARALERIARVTARADRTYEAMGIPACSSRLEASASERSASAVMGR